MTSYFSSSSWTWRLRCSSSSHPGALWEMAVTWSLMTGTIASTNSVTAATTSTMTTTTAYGRRMLRRMKNSTAGLRPAARNIATTISTR